MRIGLHPKAASELDSIANHLDDDWFGLGERFFNLTIVLRKTSNSIPKHMLWYYIIIRLLQALVGSSWIIICATRSFINTIWTKN